MDGLIFNICYFNMLWKLAVSGRIKLKGKTYILPGSFFHYRFNWMILFDMFWPEIPSVLKPIDFTRDTLFCYQADRFIRICAMPVIFFECHVFSFYIEVPAH